MKTSKPYWIIFGIIVLVVVASTISSNSDKSIGNNDKNICIKMVADIKRDGTICNNIAETSQVKQFCFKSVAFLLADKTLCDSAGSLKEDCIKEVNQLCSSCLEEGIVCPEYYRC